MKITERQRMLISKLDQVVYRKKMRGLSGYYLGSDDCTYTIYSMIVKGLIRQSGNQQVLVSTGVTPRA